MKSTSHDGSDDDTAFAAGSGSLLPLMATLAKCRSGLCGYHSQEPGIGIPRRGHSRDDPALRNAAAEPALHRRDPREAVGRAGGARRRQSQSQSETSRAAGGGRSSMNGLLRGPSAVRAIVRLT